MNGLLSRSSIDRCIAAICCIRNNDEIYDFVPPHNTTIFFLSCSIREMKVRRKITDIFYNIHLSLDIWLCVCLCLALQLKIYYIFYIMAAESTQKFKSTNFYRIIKSFRFAVRKRRIQYEGWSWLVAEEEKSWTMQGWISGNLADVEVNYPLKCLRKILEDFLWKSR